MSHPPWYRNAVIYQVDPALFLDTDDDGWGDLAGVSERLPYVRGLGAECVWLTPFYRSPYRDGGYDVTDHLAVDPRHGDLGDFAHLLDTAEDLGLRVLVDLVAQHTSIDHRWFQEARSDRKSRFHDYYVWADEPHETGVEPVFPSEEDSVWEWDETAQRFYRHTFYSHEPDLELGNPEVREEIFKIMSFWLRLGVAGFRVDAAPYLIERARAADPSRDGLWLFEDMRKLVNLQAPGAVLVGEADLPAEEYADYFGRDDRLTMLLDFWKANHLFLALARAEAEPMRRAIAEQPGPPSLGHYAVFARNHDELDLERLTKEERGEVEAVFAPDPDMRIYETGIRRRLAPMLDGDVHRLTMAHALLLSLPGSPVLLYGDEIGMGENLSRKGRSSVRLPMQWSNRQNGGFSDASNERLANPAVAGGRFGYERVNVFDQASDPQSLLSRVTSLVRARLDAVEIGSGTCEVLDVGASSVLCLCYTHAGRNLVTAVNLAPDRVECQLPDRLGGDLVDVITDEDFTAGSGAAGAFALSGYGYRWCRG